MLVEQHADRNTAKIETIKEVLDVLVGNRVIPISFSIFNYTLCHGRDHIIVTVANCDQSIGEPRVRQQHSRNLIFHLFRSKKVHFDFRIHAEII